jgi:phage gpG-like protein
MIRGVIVGKDEFKGRLTAAYANTDPEMQRSMARLVLSLVRRIKEKLGGEVLKARTGRLRRSIHGEVRAAGASSIQGEAATNVEYAAIHEYGGTTAPHDILPKRGRALAFAMNGRQFVFAKVHHPGSKIPERSFMRSALDEMSPEIRAEFKDALTRVLRTV